MHRTVNKGTGKTGFKSHFLIAKLANKVSICSKIKNHTGSSNLFVIEYVNDQSDNEVLEVCMLFTFYGLHTFRAAFLNIPQFTVTFLDCSANCVRAYVCVKHTVFTKHTAFFGLSIVNRMRLFRTDRLPAE